MVAWSQLFACLGIIKAVGGSFKTKITGSYMAFRLSLKTYGINYDRFPSCTPCSISILTDTAVQSRPKSVRSIFSELHEIKKEISFYKQWIMIK